MSIKDVLRIYDAESTSLLIEIAHRSYFASLLFSFFSLRRRKTINDFVFNCGQSPLESPGSTIACVI